MDGDRYRLTGWTFGGWAFRQHSLAFIDAIECVSAKARSCNGKTQQSAYPPDRQAVPVAVVRGDYGHAVLFIPSHDGSRSCASAAIVQRRSSSAASPAMVRNSAKSLVRELRRARRPPHRGACHPEIGD
jgi:hypothetical protein